MPHIKAGRLNIYYEIAGTGERLLHIGGTGGDLRKPGNVFTTPLTTHFEVLGFDQRGLGQTDKPEKGYTMADYADDAANLLSAIGWDRCMVMGISFGGMVAQELALRYPDKVSRLVLCCTATGGAGGASYPLHKIPEMSPEDALRFRIPITDTRRDVRWQADNVDQVERIIADGLALQAVGAGEPGREYGARGQLEARAGHNTWGRINQIELPTLVCGGKFDGQAEPSVVEALAGRISGARLEWFEGGHMFLAQDATAYEVIVKFLAG